MSDVLRSLREGTATVTEGAWTVPVPAVCDQAAQLALSDDAHARLVGSLGGDLVVIAPEQNAARPACDTAHLAVAAPLGGPRRRAISPA